MKTTDGDMLDDEQQRELLALARETISNGVSARTLPDLPVGEAYEVKRAVFVTLHVGEQLRGCIGTLEACDPLAAAVRSSAVSAATEDPRFPPVTPQELSELEIEISILSPMQPITSADEIEIGRHGVVVSQGANSGVFLPQVALEQGWDRDTMLEILCTQKAGLPADAWRRGAQLEVFTAQVFGERQ